MKTFYNKISKTKFTSLTILFCFLGDIFFARFTQLKLSYNNNQFLKDLLNLALQQKQAIENIDVIPAEFITQQANQMYNNALIIMFVAILAHCIIYIFHAKAKQYATKYIKMLSWLGVLCSLSLFISKLTKLPEIDFGILAIIPSALYFFVAVGLIYNKHPEKVRE